MTDKKPLKRLEVCPKCGGYMRRQSAFQNDSGRRDWKNETYRRAFGGVELHKFACEKCGHVETYQLDELKHLKEDE